MVRKFALILIFTLPSICFIGLLLSSQMPNCVGGSSGPASGCIFLGINLNWFMQLNTFAWIGSIFTVPIGLAILLIYSGVDFFKRDSAKKFESKYDFLKKTDNEN